MLTPSQLAALQTLIPAERIHDDAATLERYGQDWTRYTKPQAAAVVFPRSIEEVQAWCAGPMHMPWPSCHPVAAPACPAAPWRRRAKWWCPSSG
ncbi:hypothetical protein [Aquitalea magnusonii]|uniref:hypothetical protein n=1 Tax=Aquitalea magnusonii TaxID=332411 RepID=UPI001EFBFE37|nr:hypothetical protein [Aquitalea magnusonii]